MVPKLLKIFSAILFFSFAFLIVTQNSFAETTTLFSDNVEQGLNGWTIIGNTGTSEPALWHQTERSSSSPTHSWYYGKEDTGNFETVTRNWGYLTSKAISVPSGAENVTLQFSQFLSTENTSSSSGGIYYDIAKVEVSNDANTWNSLGTFRSSPGSWEHVYTSIPSYYLGSTVYIRFSFDTVDSVANNYEGWYVDDIIIDAQIPTPTPTVTPTPTETPTPTPTPTHECNRPAEVSLLDNTTPKTYPGDTVSNEFIITNPNDTGCGPTIYGISKGYPAGWTMASSYSITVNPGETSYVPFSITSSSNASVGVYDYTLYANGGYGATGHVEIIARNTSPVAQAGLDQNSFTNQVVYFDGSASSDKEGLIMYLWDFGDGSQSTNITPSHTYTSAGTYTVTLTVTDQEQLTSQDSLTVTVVNDTVNITKAVFSASKKTLTVETSSNSVGAATLTVLGIGQMTYDPVANVYRLVKSQGYISSVTVQSSFGGSSTSPVAKVSK